MNKIERLIIKSITTIWAFIIPFSTFEIIQDKSWVSFLVAFGIYLNTLATEIRISYLEYINNKYNKK
mgnify:FL=1